MQNQNSKIASTVTLYCTIIPLPYDRIECIHIIVQISVENASYFENNSEEAGNTLGKLELFHVENWRAFSYQTTWSEYRQKIYIKKMIKILYKNFTRNARIWRPEKRLKLQKQSLLRLKHNKWRKINRLRTKSELSYLNSRKFDFVALSR